MAFLILLRAYLRFSFVSRAHGAHGHQRIHCSRHVHRRLPTRYPAEVRPDVSSCCPSPTLHCSCVVRNCFGHPGHRPCRVAGSDQFHLFSPAFVFSAFILLVFNIFGLIILDWLVFFTFQPRSMVLPGTDEMAGYHNYRFHFIGFLKGLGFSAVVGLVTGDFKASSNG
jgi:hypothetical protein